MKFNEKLIKLRKEKGLSQEELGYELNVTRQTISKWELGQTTPEMEKLLDIAKFFEISVDELAGDADVISDYEGKEHSKRNIIIITILVVTLLLIGTFIFVKLIAAPTSFIKEVFGQTGKIVEQISEIDAASQEKQEERIGNMVSDFQEKTGDTANTVFNFLKNTQEEYDKGRVESEKRSFNLEFELNSGTVWASRVRALLDDVIKNNQTNDRIVTVKYENTSTTDASEIRNLKRNFDNENKKYEVYFNYDEEGYIYEAIIEKI